MKAKVLATLKYLGLLIVVVLTYRFFESSEPRYVIGIVAMAIYLVWFFKRWWKGFPPKGWKTSDGGKTWHPPR